MMTLQELEETVDHQDEVLKRSSSTVKDSVEVQGGILHSTQSITGRQSLYTLDHVQHISATDALNAYIDNFEESHPLQTSSYIYNRTPEDLLLPQSILSQTVDRSLKTGKKDTKEEFHLHNVKRIIDESYSEILRADLETEKAEAVLLSSELLTKEPSSDVSSLPDPNQTVNMTPLLKSTPIQNYSSMQFSKPSRTASFRNAYSDTKKHKTLHKFGLFSRSSYKRQTSTKYPARNKKEIPSFVSGDKTNMNNLSKSHDTKLSPRKGFQSPALNDSFVSGGRPPPSWVDDLDISQVSSIPKREGDSALKKGGNPSLKKLGFKKEELMHDGIDVGSVSSYGIDEVALLEEVEHTIEQRRHERRRKEAEAQWMRKRWQIDRRNESLFERPPNMRYKPQRTESVTTEDLVTASPYGLDKKKSSSVDKGPLFESSKYRTVGNLHPYQPTDLATRMKNHYLPKSEGSMQERTMQYRERKLSRSDVFKSLGRNHLSHLITPNMLRKVKEPTEPLLPSRHKKPGAFVDCCPSTAPSGHTDSLILASPFAEVKSHSTALARKMESPHIFRKKLKTVDDQYSESHPGMLTGTGGGATVGTVGDTSRVEAVISRAQRLMGASTDNEYRPHYKRSPLNSTYPGSIIDRYLGDCLQSSQENSDQQRPLESLKQILFTLQDLEDTYNNPNHPSIGLQAKEEQTPDKPSKEDVVGLDGLSIDHSDKRRDDCHVERKLEPGGESMKKALAHLSRLKLLISEGDTPTSGSIHGSPYEG